MHSEEKFDLEEVQTEVRDYLASVMIATKDEEMFWQDFSVSIVILSYLMALWKCRDKKAVNNTKNIVNHKKSTI